MNKNYCKDHEELLLNKVAETGMFLVDVETV